MIGKTVQSDEITPVVLSQAEEFASLAGGMVPMVRKVGATWEAVDPVVSLGGNVYRIDYPLGGEDES